MDDLETRELRYFVAVAEELHFGRAAVRLGVAQPPLSRAIRLLERRLGVRLFDRNRQGTTLTDAGRVLLVEGRAALHAVGAAVRRTRQAADPQRPLVLATEAGASHGLLQRLLDAVAAAGAHPVDVLLCEAGEQAGLVRSGRADIALMHRPFDDLAGFASRNLCAESQVAILPAAHPLAGRDRLTLAEVCDVPGLPMARWPRPDGSYPDGPGPEVRTRSHLAQLVALGRTLLVVPGSSLTWQSAEHVAVPVTDAPEVTAVLVWAPNAPSPALTAFTRTAAALSAIARAPARAADAADRDHPAPRS